MSNQIREAVEVLKNGGIVIFPTDTAFGIGCRIDNENAIKRLFKIRKRPENKPILALVDSVQMAQSYLLPIPRNVQDKLISPYWPGKLTIILKSNTDKVLFLVRGGGNTLGVRFPNDSTLLALIKGVGVPIVAPSANFHGKKTPYEFKDLDPDLVKLVDYVVDGECLLKKPSTVVDCSRRPWKIIREGAVKIWLR